MTVQRRQARRPYAWLTPLIILVAVVALVIGAIAVHYMESQLVATTGESLALTSSDIADMLDRILFERYSDIQMLSQAGVFQGRDRTAMTEYFATLKKIYPVYLWLSATDANGRIIASTDPASVGRDRSGSEWYRAVRARGDSCPGCSSVRGLRQRPSGGLLRSRQRDPEASSRAW
jgi:hypothetical protein